MARAKNNQSTGEQLPVSRMALRLVPYAIRSGAGERDAAPSVVVNYAANFHPLPGGTDISDLPDPPAADLPGAPLQPLAVEIAVQPIVTNDENGNEELSFSIDALVPCNPNVEKDQAAAQTALSPWKHDVSSDLVNECIARVQDAGPGDRYQRILELADAMMAPLDPKQ